MHTDSRDIKKTSLKQVGGRKQHLLKMITVFYLLGLATVHVTPSRRLSAHKMEERKVLKGKVIQKSGKQGENAG